MLKRKINLIKKVKYSQPHFVWPERDNLIEKKVFKYYQNYKNGKNGLPDVIEKFEEKFKKIHKSKFCMAVSSGTAALHTAYFSAGIKKGDEVIVSNYTFPATVIPLFILGAKPVLCDCDKIFANIDESKIENLITKKTKAIVVTHWWGQPCNMAYIVKLTKKYNLKLIEDCAHAPGAKYKNKLVGTFGDFGCFSLDNNKLLASGEGGVLIIKNLDSFQKAIIFSDFGPRLYNDVNKSFFKNFIQTGIGTKYRIHFLAAKIAYEKLFKLKKMNSDRKEIFNYFSNKLKKSKLLISPINLKNFQRGGYYGFKVIMKRNNKINIFKFIKLLKEKNVDARQTVTPPLHMTRTFKNNNLSKIFKGYKLNFNPNNLKNSYWFHKNHISFPTFYKKNHKKIIDEYIRVILSIEKAINI